MKLHEAFSKRTYRKRRTEPVSHAYKYNITSEDLGDLDGIDYQVLATIRERLSREIRDTYPEPSAMPGIDLGVIGHADDYVVVHVPSTMSQRELEKMIQNIVDGTIEDYRKAS